MTQVVRTRAELESVLHGVSVGSAAVDAVPAGSGGGGAVPAGSGGGAVPAGSGGGAVPAGSAAGGAVPAGSAAGGALSTGRGRVALVPTMGALHAGHRSLMGEARRRVTEDGALVVSIFVNPLQFGPGEDFDRYPRAFDADVAICEEQGVDVVFAPSVDEVYPGGDSAGSTVTVDPGPLATVLEGRFRPSHFRGVLTVVAKLFGLVRPDLAVFGEKDYQQLVLIRRMVADLCMPVDVVGAETVREDGGLAMSSRNAYLSEGQRTAALGLSRALRAAADAAPAGADHALAAAHAVLRGTPGVDLDYLEITSPDLGPPPERGEARALVAARVGTTRLIDNVPVQLGASR